MNGNSTKETSRDEIPLLQYMFGGAETLSGMLDYAAGKFGELAAVMIRENGMVMERSYLRLQADSARLSGALTEMGVRNKNIAVIGSISYEWLVAFFGITGSGNAVVPLDKDLHPSDLVSLMLKSDSVALFADNSRLDIARTLMEQCNQLEAVISFRPAEGFSDVLGLGDAKGCGGYEQNAEPPQPDQTAMIVFTAGEDGTHRGVMLSHRNISDDTRCSVHLLGQGTLAQEERTVPVLPPHHMLSITAGILVPLLYFGNAVCLGGGLNDYLKNMKQFRPAMLIMVPIIAESLYKRIWREARQNGKEEWLKSALEGSRFRVDLTFEAKRELFREVLGSLGGELRIIVCGGASLNPELVDKFGELGIRLLNGYGITECSPVVSCNTPDDIERTSVGHIVPRPYCEVRVKNGEIQVRGSIVMKGYYQDEHSTRAAFEDGWFRTGDLGRVDEHNRLYLTGRMKDLIILKDGNNISPAELERSLEAHPLVDQALVYAAQREMNEILAVAIHPDFRYASNNGIDNVAEVIEDWVDAFNLSSPAYKRIRRIEICDEDFDKLQWKKNKRLSRTEPEE